MKQFQQANRAIIWHTNHESSSHDTPTSSIRSFKMYNEEFQSPTAEISSTYPNATLVMTSSHLSSALTATQVLPQRELLQYSHQKVVPDEHDQVTDGNDTMTSRLYENCVRLQQSFAFPTFIRAIGTFDSSEAEARAQEYRRACRPQRIYFDEVVPSDLELGFQPSRRKSVSNTVLAKDELLYPTKRDTGIMNRYFGMSDAESNYIDDDDDDNGCPNHASISSGSSFLSSSSGLSDNSSDNNDDGYYDANWYDDDLRELGELVDL